ncbi:MAG: hypothetical protein ABFD86_09930 [Bryobacteraceae bacterium]
MSKCTHKVVLLCGLYLAGALQAGGMGFLDLIVPEFRTEKATVPEACEELAKAGALITLETLPSEKVVRFSLHLRNQTIRAILDAVVKADQRYEWREHSSLAWPYAKIRVINILPAGAVSDKTNLMNVQIGHADLDNVNVEDVFKSPLDFLPELRQTYVRKVRFRGVAISEIMPLTPPTQLSRVCVKLHDVTVRDVLNELAIKSGGIGWKYDGLEHRWNVFR